MRVGEPKINFSTEQKQLQEKEYKDFFDLLVKKEIPFYVAGGVGINILMEKEALSTLHKDIDIILPGEVEGQAKKILTDAGYTISIIPIKKNADRTYKFIARRGNLVADMGFFQKTEKGYVFEIPAGNKMRRIVFNEESLNSLPGLYSGISVHTLSPLGMIQSMLWYPKPLRSQDITTIQDLASKFFPGEDTESIKARITR